MSKWNPVEYLKSLHTKQLMPMLDACRACGHDAYEVSNEPNYGLRWVTKDQIKAELATREHVPNKIEAKVIPQAKAKAKKNK